MEFERCSSWYKEPWPMAIGLHERYVYDYGVVHARQKYASHTLCQEADTSLVLSSVGSKPLPFRGDVNCAKCQVLMAELELAERKDRAKVSARLQKSLAIMSNEELLSEFKEAIRYLRHDSVEYDTVVSEFYRRLRACGYM